MHQRKSMTATRRHRDGWDPWVLDQIERRVAKHFDDLLTTLGLYEYRYTSLTVVEDAFEGITEALWRGYAYLRNSNQGLSIPRIRKELERLLEDPASIVENMHQADSRVRAAVMLSWPGGRLLSEAAICDQSACDTAVRNALASLPKSGRGRPKGSKDEATAVFARILAETYYALTGDKPTRRVHSDTGREYGPFRDFVEAVVQLIPRRIHRGLHPHSLSTTKGIDHIVRLGVESFRTPRC